MLSGNTGNKNVNITCSHWVFQPQKNAPLFDTDDTYYLGRLLFMFMSLGNHVRKNSPTIMKIFSANFITKLSAIDRTPIPDWLTLSTALLNFIPNCENLRELSELFTICCPSKEVMTSFLY